MSYTDGWNVFAALTRDRDCLSDYTRMYLITSLHE